MIYKEEIECAYKERCFLKSKFCKACKFSKEEVDK